MRAKFFPIIILTVLIAFPFVVLAQATTNPPPPPIEDWAGIVRVLQKAVVWMYEAFFIVAVGFILWAAYLFLSAGGNEQKVEEAKKRLMNAVIAIVIALVASGVAKIIQTFLKP